MANKIPQSFIDQLLARTDIVDVIDGYVSLKKTGSNYMACCPFHQENTPSFSVSQRKQFYHCFGCGASGNAITFMMNYEGRGFREVIAQLAQSVGMEVPLETMKDDNHNNALYDITRQAAQYYQQQLKTAAHAIDYLKTREVSGEIAKRYGLGYAPTGWDNLLKQFEVNQQNDLLKTGLIIENDQARRYDRFRDRVIFPIRDRRGRYIGFGGRVLTDEKPKYLNSPETVIFHKGTELYGLYEAKQQQRQLDRIIIVEGYMDVILLAQHGIDTAVATLGTATSANHIKTLQRQTSNILFCFDGDTAGRTAAWRALTICLPLMNDTVKIAFMFLPQGEDPDSFVCQHGKEAFLKSCQQAKALATFFFEHLLENIDISTVEGRANCQQQAMTHINQVPDNYFKQGLLEELGKITRLQQQTVTINNAPPKSMPSKAALPSALRSIISLLLQNPNLALECPDDISSLNIHGSDFVAELIAIIKKQPNQPLGTLLEHWRDSHIGGELHKLASAPLLIPEVGLKKELLDAIERLKVQGIEQEIEGLIAKAATPQGLDQQEKEYLQNLIRNKNAPVAS